MKLAVGYAFLAALKGDLLITSFGNVTVNEIGCCIECVGDIHKPVRIVQYGC
jgi:hypothetical protein